MYLSVFNEFCRPDLLSKIEKLIRVEQSSPPEENITIVLYECKVILSQKYYR